MSLDIGINFRGTSGYVTDGANQTYCIGDAYPTTRGGVTFGWSAAVNSEDRSTGVDVRVAGINYKFGATRTFQLDLPATGVYDVHFAAGDPLGAQRVDWSLRDDTTEFAATSGSTSGANKYKDATNVERSSDSDWATNEVKVTRTFASTTLKIVNTATDDNIVLAHVRVVQVASGNRRRRVICGAAT